MPKHTKENYRKLLKAGKVSELIDKLSSDLEHFLDSHPNDESSQKIYNNIILHSIKLKDVNDHHNIGTIDYSELSKEKAKIYFSLLEIINQLPPYFLDYTNGEAVNIPLGNVIKENKNPLSEVEITLEGLLSQFDKEKKRILVDTVAAILNIDTTAIRIKRVVSGSIKVTLELPRNKANTLIDFAEIKDFQALIKSITNNKIKILTILNITSHWLTFKIISSYLKSLFTKNITALILGTGTLITVVTLITVFNNNQPQENHVENSFLKDLKGELITKKTERAISDIQTKIENATTNFNNLIVDGDSLYESKQYKKAKEKFAEALEYAKEEGIDSHVAEQKIQECNDALKKSYEEWKKAGESNMANEEYENALSNFKKAQSFIDTKEIRLIIEDLESKIKQSKLYDSLLIQGDLHIEKTDYKSALIKYKEAQEIKNTSEVKMKIANCLSLLKKIDLQNYKSWKLKGDSLFAAKKFAEAETAYLKAQSYSDTDEIQDLINLCKKNKPSTIGDILIRIEKNMTTIPAGSFTMGCLINRDGYRYYNYKDRKEDKKCNPKETPPHVVNIKSFKMGMYEVTQQEWNIIMGIKNRPYYCEECPVSNVSWQDANRFIKKLNTLTKSPENPEKYRLPTEAEWEYAARSGNDFQYSGGNNLNRIAWNISNTRSTTSVFNKNTQQPVGTKDPNSFGLYDMTGNVSEWCEDTWRMNYSEAPSDGSALVKSGASYRIHRGGSYMSASNQCRISAYSDAPETSGNPEIGFRLVLSYH